MSDPIDILPLPDWPDVIATDCPVCGAESGERCRAVDGVRPSILAAHGPRIDEARKEANSEPDGWPPWSHVV